MRWRHPRSMPSSPLVDLASVVVCDAWRSANAAYHAAAERIPVSSTSVYGELDGVEPAVSAALVRHAAARPRGIGARGAGAAGAEALAPIAKCCHRWQASIMGVQITIRDVPEAVRRELATRAAQEHKSMQEYLRGELVRLAARPSLHAWLEQVRERKHAAGRRVSPRQILAQRNADRR